MIFIQVGVCPQDSTLLLTYKTHRGKWGYFAKFVVNISIISGFGKYRQTDLYIVENSKIVLNVAY
jgi:hypothetical protein